jgi:hypothetical protein
MGTFLAGRRFVGAMQIALSSTGFVLSLYWFGAFARQCWRQGELVLDGGPLFCVGLTGAGLFAFAWLWGLVSGLQIRRSSRKSNL